MSELSISRLLTVLALASAADLAICVAATVAAALPNGNAGLFGALASGAILFVFVYFVAGFVLVSAVWRLIANRLGLASPLLAIGSSALLTTTVAALYFGSGTNLVEGMPGPILVGAVLLHGLAMWRIAASVR